MAEAAARRILADDWRAAILLAAGLTLARVVALFRSPLELYPDEAQYWLWSRVLDFGYYSKPPMVAWTIWATTAIGGDAEPWVRMGAVLFQAGALLLVFAIARRLYGGGVALAAAALYALAPAIQLSAVVIATDSPMLFFLGLTILAYVTLQEAQGRARLWVAGGVGAALGLAFLSKYAAIYGVVGIGLHLALSKEARRAWSPGGIALAVAAFAAVLAPNLVWNAQHGFATVQHTAANAAWGGRQLFNFEELGEFLITQFLVFGPIPFGALVAGLVLGARRKQPWTKADLLLLCFTLPPLVIVTGQAFISRANANWSGASYLPGAILAAAWLIRWRARRWLIAAVVMQALLAATFLAFAMSPALAERAGAANSFKRAKGWSQMTELILDRAEVERGGGLSAVAVNNRFLYYAMNYYGRDRLPGLPPLKVWLLTGAPQNQAETSAPLTPADGKRVLGVALEGNYQGQMMADFRRTLGVEIASVSLDRQRRRKAVLFVGEDFAPRPRPAAGSGSPTPP